MRTILFVLVAIFTSSIYANFPLFNIVEFNGVYQDGVGQAKAKKFRVKDYDFGDNPEFSVEKQGSSLYLTTPEDEFTFNDIPLVSDNLKTLKWNGINATSDGYNIKLAIQNLVSQVSENIIKANNFSIGCTHSGSKKSDALLDSCFNNKGQISFKQIQNISKGKKTSIKDFSISMSNKRFSFRLNSSAKVKGNGEVSYKDKKLTFKITKAKAGMFNVIKRFFKELKKIESDKIKVSRPYITISM